MSTNNYTVPALQSLLGLPKLKIHYLLRTNAIKHTKIPNISGKQIQFYQITPEEITRVVALLSHTKQDNE